MKKIFFFVCMISLLGTSAQEVQSFIRSYGYDGFHYGKRIAVLADTSYLIMGNKSGTGSQSNIYLIHVDKTGQIIKDNVFGGTELFYGTDMIVVGDTDIYVCGYVLNSSEWEYDNLVIRVNFNLEQEHIHEFAFHGWDFAKGITADKKGMKYVVSQNSVEYERPSVLLHKFDENLMLTEEVYFGNDTFALEPTAIVLSGDTSLFVSGFCETATGFKKGYIFKADTTLMFLDTLYLLKDSADVEILDMDTTHYGGVVFTGKVTCYDDDSRRLVYGITDENLNITHLEWGFHPNDWCNCIKTAPFSDLIVYAGYTTSAGSGGSDFNYQLFEGGVYQLSSTIGGIMYDEAFDCAFALDSTIVLLGTTKSYGQTQTSIMFAKTCKNYYYCVSDQQHILEIQEDMQAESDVLLYPVPASMFIYVTVTEQLPPGRCSFELISMNGAVVECDYMNTDPQNFVVSVPNLPSGIYVLRFSKGSWTSSHKLIINR